jgi:hypothetical protein
VPAFLQLVVLFVAQTVLTEALLDVRGNQIPHVFLALYERVHKGVTILHGRLVRLVRHAQQTAKTTHLLVDIRSCVQTPKAEIPPTEKHQDCASQYSQQSQCQVQEPRIPWPGPDQRDLFDILTLDSPLVGAESLFVFRPLCSQWQIEPWQERN